jgi:hypothetical protein
VLYMWLRPADEIGPCSTTPLERPSEAASQIDDPR